MITIIYKYALNRYLISEIKEACGDEILIKIDEPINASLMIGKKAFHIERGTAKIKCRDLSDGKISPRFYRGKRLVSLEGFILNNGSVIRDSIGDELSRELASELYSLSKTVKELSDRITELEDKVSGKITF